MNREDIIKECSKIVKYVSVNKHFIQAHKNYRREFYAIRETMIMLGLYFHQITLEKSFRFFLEDVIDVVKYTFKRWLLIVYKTFSFPNSLVDLLVPRNFIVVFMIIFK